MVSCRLLLFVLFDRAECSCNCQTVGYDVNGNPKDDHKICQVDINNAKERRTNNTSCSIDPPGPTCCAKKIITDPDDGSKIVELHCLDYSKFREEHIDYGANCQDVEEHGKQQECCCETCPDEVGHYCTVCPKGGYNILIPIAPSTDPEQSSTAIYLIFSLSVVLAIFAGVYSWKKNILCFKSSEDLTEAIEIQDHLIPGGQRDDHNTHTVSTIVNQNPDGSSSGQGEAELVVSTISREIRLGSLVGKGRFGIVYHGTWSGKDVAAKIFDSRDAESWKRETEIYSTTLINHANILHYIAQDNKDAGIALELWLITDYHERGSLYDFLKGNSVSITDALLLAYTACAGIEHLHKEINGTQGKPQIAHRDIKSKNILVKSDGQCAVADFGLAVVFDSQRQVIDLPKGTTEKFLVGTKRYMAPELLSATFRDEDFMSFRRADIYSLSLVLWEIASRTILFEGHTPAPYKLPYEDDVNAEPTIQMMHAIVCQEKKRPPFSSIQDVPRSLRLCSWERLCKVACECWTEEATWRLSALKMKKDLSSEYLKLRPPQSD